MTAKKVRRSYDLPENLAKYFKDWKPGRDLSPKVAGAIFYYMQLPPDIREACEKAAYSDDIEKAIKELEPAMKPDRLYAMQDRFEKLLDDFSKIAKLSQAQRRSNAGEKAGKSRISRR